MAKSKVRARIAELMQPVIERAQLSRDQWLESLARICLDDIRKIFDEHGNPIAITKFADSEAAAIAGYAEKLCQRLTEWLLFNIQRGQILRGVDRVGGHLVPVPVRNQ